MRILLALFLFSSACAVEQSDPLLDDDDASDDDDAWTPPEPLPLEGDWSGPTAGTTILDGGVTFSCTGEGSITVDEDDFAHGRVECMYPETQLRCSYDITDVEVGRGAYDTTYTCLETGEAQVSVWFDGQMLYGRIQLLTDSILTDMRWDLRSDAEDPEDPEG